jgi:hypothetical protein
MHNVRHVKEFFALQIKEVVDLEGFDKATAIDLRSSWEEIYVPHSLVNFVVNELLTGDVEQQLVAFTWCNSCDDSETFILLCTTQGIYVITIAEVHGIVKPTLSFKLNYFIPFSEIDFIGCTKKGFFKKTYFLSIFQKGENGEAGWFFKDDLEPMITYFKDHGQRALLNYESDDNFSSSFSTLSDSDITTLEARINRLYMRKLLSKSDYDIKRKSIPKHFTAS